MFLETSLKYLVNYSSSFSLHHMRSLCKIVLMVSNGLPPCKASQQEEGGNRAKIATRVSTTGEKKREREREREKKDQYSESKKGLSSSVKLDTRTKSRTKSGCKVSGRGKKKEISQSFPT